MRILELTRNMLCECDHGVLYHNIHLYANCTDINGCEYTGCNCKDIQEKNNNNEDLG